LFPHKEGQEVEFRVAFYESFCASFFSVDPNVFMSVKKAKQS